MNFRDLMRKEKRNHSKASQSSKLLRNTKMIPKVKRLSKKRKKKSQTNRLKKLSNESYVESK